MVWGWRSGACEGLGLEQIWKPLREREREMVFGFCYELWTLEIFG